MQAGFYEHLKAPDLCQTAADLIHDGHLAAGLSVLARLPQDHAGVDASSYLTVLSSLVPRLLVRRSWDPERAPTLLCRRLAAFAPTSREQAARGLFESVVDVALSAAGTADTAAIQRAHTLLLHTLTTCGPSAVIGVAGDAFRLTSPRLRALSLTPSPAAYLHVMRAFTLTRSHGDAQAVFSHLRTRGAALPVHWAAALDDAAEAFDVGRGMALFDAAVRGATAPDVAFFNAAVRVMALGGEERSAWRLREAMRVCGVPDALLAPWARAWLGKALGQHTCHTVDQFTHMWFPYLADSRADPDSFARVFNASVHMSTNSAEASLHGRPETVSGKHTMAADPYADHQPLPLMMARRGGSSFDG